MDTNTSPNFSRNSKGELQFYGSPLLASVSDGVEPAYVYHLGEIQKRAQFFKQCAEKYLGSNIQIHYAMKANSHPQVLKTLMQAQIGLDVVSGGELEFGHQQGAKPEQIIFSGVGKTKKEITAAIQSKIFQINVESVPELQRVAEISRALSLPARIALRVNPNVDVKTHPHIATGLRENKFGIEIGDLPAAVEIIRKNSQLQWQGLSLHIGSQIFDFSSIKLAVEKLLQVQEQLVAQGFQFSTFDVGGGVGVDYTQNGEKDFELLEKYFQTLQPLLKGLSSSSSSSAQASSQSSPHTSSQKILFEPGRFLVARTGVLLTEVQYVKKTPYKTFVICNTGMHHLMRPVLYEAFHQIQPVVLRPGADAVVDFVGPVCESADFIARSRSCSPVAAGDWLAIADAGAYGQTMSSQYNMFSPPRMICI